MGYRADGDLRYDLFPGEEFIRDTGKEITDTVGTRMRDKIAFRTPVARLPQAYKGEFEEWIMDRGGRTPRTMRDSWVRTAVFDTDEGHTVEVASSEPKDDRGFQKVDYVEDDTRPHLIRAGVRSGPKGVYQGSLRFPMGPNFMYRVEVWHPGTQGVHMVRDTEAEMEAIWEEIAGPILARKESEFSDRL